jgi:hypothetical protein
MTYNPNLDRTDWRTLSDITLIQAARDCPNELAIVLGERLDDAEHDGSVIADLQAKNDELGQRVDALIDELRDLKAAYDAQSDA